MSRGKRALTGFPQKLTLALIMAESTVLVPDPANGADGDAYATARAALVAEIEAHVRETQSYLGKDRLDPRVIAAIGRAPRHAFVPEDLRHAAYNDHPLPIGHGQTISQPYIVAVMTDLLSIPAEGRVLEIGTGSGYQAAVLAEMGVAVYSIEIVEPLGLRAKSILAKLGYDNVKLRIGDGFRGWPEAAPFDAIIVTAAADRAPAPLLDQLRPGGRMIIPLNRRFGAQELVLIEKSADGGVDRESVLPVRFVPLTRDPD